MNTELECMCDIDFRCDNHPDDYEYWAQVFGLKPFPYNPADAYDVDDYKSRSWEGWDAA